MSTQYRLVQSGKTASGGCSAGQGSSEPVAPRIYLLFIIYEIIQFLARFLFFLFFFFLHLSFFLRCRAFITLLLLFSLHESDLTVSMPLHFWVTNTSNFCSK
jgi:hypothetical protein